jgi:hypothetical protein
MKNVIILSFLIFSTIGFSQRITGTILDSETKEPIERAHVFFINKTVYTNQKGEFSFSLNKNETVSFSVSHLKYQAQKISYNKTKEPLVIFLYEKQEMLEGIKISGKKSIKKSIDFTKLNDLPKGVYSFASVLNKSKIHVFGGDASSEYDKNKEGLSQLQFSDQTEIMKFLTRSKAASFYNYVGDIQSYSISQNKWSIQKNKVIKRAYHNAISYKDTVLLIGGKKLSRTKSRDLLATDIENVSLRDFSIIKDETNPHQAVDFGTVLYDNKILVFGGSIKKQNNGKIVFSNDIHFYDLEKGYWYLLTKMPKAKEVTGIVFGDKLYLFGGYNNRNLTDIESFNLNTGKWKKEGTLFRGMRKPAITKDNDFIYLNENGKIVTFAPKTNILKEYKIDLNLNDANLHFFNETLYLIGGYHVEEFKKYPSNGLYSINVSEFVDTRPINSKKL